MTTLAPSFLIGSSSFLQVTKTSIKAWMGLKFGKIQPGTGELSALGNLEKSPLTYDWVNVVTSIVHSLLFGSSYFLQYR